MSGGQSMAEQRAAAQQGCAREEILATAHQLMRAGVQPAPLLTALLSVSGALVSQMARQGAEAALMDEAVAALRTSMLAQLAPGGAA